MKKRSSQAAALGLSAITIGTLISPMEVLAAENSDSSVLAPSEGVETSDVNAGDVASGIADLASNISSSRTSKELVDSAEESNDTISKDCYLELDYRSDYDHIPEDEAAAEEFWDNVFPYPNAEVKKETDYPELDQELIEEEDTDDDIIWPGNDDNSDTDDDYYGKITEEIDDTLDGEIDDTLDEEIDDTQYGKIDNTSDDEPELEAIHCGLEEDLEAQALALEASVLGRARKIDTDVDNADNSLKDATIDSQRLAKSDKAMDEADGDADVAIGGATKAADGAKSVTEDAKSSAESAALIVLEQGTTKEAALSIVAEAEDSIEKADAAFAEAKADYEKALEDYEQAQLDYEVARQAYISNKERTSSDLKAAKESFDSALSRLDDLEVKLSETKNELVEKSAEVILTAEANKDGCVENYVADLIQYYYLTVEHGSLENVRNFSAVAREHSDDVGMDSIHVTYELIEDYETGETRQVEEDFCYLVNVSADNVLIFRAGLFYWYVDSNGQYHFFTPYEAEQFEIEGQPETYLAYNISGSYVPRYEMNDVLYSGTYRTGSYDTKEAFNYGFCEICDDYDIAPVGSNWYYYGEGYSHRNGWASSYNLNFSYDIQYDKVVDGKKESFDISPAESSVSYNSYRAAFNAVESMGKSRGDNAIGIDEMYSNVIITSTPLKSSYIEYGMPIVDSGAGLYMSFVNNAKAKIKAYNNLMSMIADARSEYENAAKQLEILQNQIQDLEKANDTQAIVRLAELQVKLDQAKEDFDTAKSNLIDAKEALDLAKTGFESRFKDDIPSVPAFEREPLEEKYAEIEELEEEEEIEEEVEVLQNEVADFVPSGGPSSQHNYGPAVPLVQEIVSGIEDFVDVKPEIHTNSNKPKESKKETITKAGVKERLPWFIGLGTVSTAGAGVAAFEAKRRAAMRILDKLNQ